MPSASEDPFYKAWENNFFPFLIPAVIMNSVLAYNLNSSRGAYLIQSQSKSLTLCRKFSEVFTKNVLSQDTVRTNRNNMENMCMMTAGAAPHVFLTGVHYEQEHVANSLCQLTRITISRLTADAICHFLKEHYFS